MGTLSRCCCSEMIFLNKPDKNTGFSYSSSFDLYKLVKASSSSSSAFYFTPYKKLFNSTATSIPTSTSLLSLCVKYRPISTIHASQDTQVELVASDIKDQEINEQKTVHVKFRLQKDCSFGEQFMIVGDDSILGFWDPESALPLYWSDGHIWTVELDIPVGKTILFKFILRDIMGEFLWQPGPDRVLQTWDTKNTVLVSEDWENPELQKITEEEPFANQTEETSTNAEMLLVAENLNHQEEEMLLKANGTTVASSNSYPTKKQSSETPEESVFCDKNAVPQEKPAAIVADNISYTEKYPGEKTVSHANDEKLTTLNKDKTIAKEVHGDNSGATDILDVESRGGEGNLIIHEQEPVLVPGLSPISIDPSEVAGTIEEESTTATDTSFGENEVKNHNIPELDEKHEREDDSHEEKMSMAHSIEVDTEAKLKGSSVSEDEGKDSKESEPAKSNILQNDIQWGRKILQKLLGSFRLL